MLAQGDSMGKPIRRSGDSHGSWACIDVGEDDIKVNGLTNDDIVPLRVREFRAAEVINGTAA